MKVTTILSRLTVMVPISNRPGAYEGGLLGHGPNTTSTLFMMKIESPKVTSIVYSSFFSTLPV